MNTNDTKNHDPDPMSHEEATKNQVAERFALGELSHEDRERFEDHFFDCAQCFRDVQLASEFIQVAHKALSRPRERRPAINLLTGFWRPAPILAVLFLCATGTGLYQESKIRELKGPKQESHFYLKEQTRSTGSEKQITVPRGIRLALEAGFTPQPEFKSYRAQIVSEPDKRVRYAVPLQVSEDDISVTIVMPPEILREGNYSLIFEGKRNDGSWIVLKDEHNQPAGGVFHLRVVS